MRWSSFEMKVENIARKSENRRSNKPLMEKRRRARINNCLNELKTLVLDAMKKDPSRHSKLEKADILEMTVKHLQNLHRQQVAFSVASDPAVMNKYCAGFSECASEVNRLISRMEGVDVTVKQRLVAHLSNYVNGSLLSATSAPPLPPHSIPVGVDGPPGGFQLIPTQLPNGDIALVLPSTNKSASPGKQRGDPHQLFFYPIGHPAIHSPLPGGQSHAGDMPLELTVHRLRRSSSVSPVESSDVDSRPGSLSPISSNFPVKMEMIYDDSVSRPRDVDLFDKDPWRPWY